MYYIPQIVFSIQTKQEWEEWYYLFLLIIDDML